MGYLEEFMLLANKQVADRVQLKLSRQYFLMDELKQILMNK